MPRACIADNSRADAFKARPDQMLAEHFIHEIFFGLPLDMHK